MFSQINYKIKLEVYTIILAIILSPSRRCGFQFGQHDQILNKIVFSETIKTDYLFRLKIVKAASEQNVYSQIFRLITTARLQVVAEKSGMYSWGDKKFIDFFVSWVVQCFSRI